MDWREALNRELAALRVRRAQVLATEREAEDRVERAAELEALDQEELAALVAVDEERAAEDAAERAQTDREAQGLLWALPHPGAADLVDGIDFPVLDIEP
jgi:predicted metal-dependent peptidase